MSNLSAQKKHTKYGKVDKSNLEMKIYDLDTSANAVILFKYGETTFNFDMMRLEHNYHVRIKILNSNGFDWANKEIYYLNYNEKIINLEAQSCNLVSGKVVKTKVENNDIFDNTISSSISVKKITFSNVKVGTILEYKYTLFSNNIYNLKDWEFQDIIPTVYNEYNITIPDNLTYLKRIKGYLPSPEMKNFLTNSDGTTYLYTMENIPAFVKEPFISSKYNYISSLVFELQIVRDRYHRIMREFTTSWDEISEELLEADNFGNQLKCPKALKKELKVITADTMTKYDKMIAIHGFIANEMKWNGANRLFTSSTIKESYKKKTGSSADINLLLIAALNEAKITTVPVVLSTRSNGFINPALPSITDFNYVIALVSIDGKRFYLDATEKYSPAGMLPKRCLNGIGRVIYKVTEEVNINTDQKSKEAYYLDLTIIDGEFAGICTEILKSYAALDFRNDYKNSTNEETFLANIEEINEGLIISEYSIENLDVIYKPLKVSYKMNITNNSNTLGDKIYFNPMFYFGINSNPFKNEERKYPVDFAYSFQKKYILTFTIPEGYTVESLPESVNIFLPDKVATFKYIIVNEGNIIQLSSNISINKNIFTHLEYPYLKELYSQIVAKHNEMIVLKKK